MPTYSLGGSVAGLSGPGLMLANGGATLPPADASRFTFPKSFQSGSSYAVTIQTQPAGQTCAITNATGTVGMSNVTNVDIACPSPWVWIGGPSSPGGGEADRTPELAFYSDLWKFDPHTGLWTWMSGSKLVDDTGQYGSEGTAAAANYTPPRGNAAALTDHAGNFWLYGGYGVDAGYPAIDLAPGSSTTCGDSIHQRASGPG